jgi:hypothetical protein
MSSSSIIDGQPLPLPGRTRAEDERILLARVGFVRALCSDPRVAACLADIDRTTGLLTAAERYMPLAAALAARIGVRDRVDLLLNPNIGRAIDAVPVTPEYEALVAETRVALAAAYVAFAQIDAPIVAAQLEVFLRGVGLPWRWLAVELIEQYRALFWTGMYGHHMEQERALGLALGPGATRRPRPGEDPAAEYQRAVTPFGAALQRYLTARRRTKLAGPKSAGHHLEHYAGWFYRHRVKSPADSLRRLARDEQTSLANIRRGIAVVEPLLDLPRERFVR